MAYSKNIGGWWEDLVGGTEDALGIGNEEKESNQNDNYVAPEDKTPTQSSDGVPVVFLLAAAVIMLLLIKKK